MTGPRCIGIALVLAAAACKIDARQDYVGDQDRKAMGLGHAPAPETVAAEDIDVLPGGAGLPAGSGTAAQGEWGLFQDFLKKPTDAAGIAKKLEAAATAAYKKGK